MLFTIFEDTINGGTLCVRSQRLLSLIFNRYTLNVNRKVTYLWGFGDDVKTRLPISWVCGCRKDAGCV